ncbi:hypothetical protein OEZ81_26235, partial [Leclercia adecarboxylata]|uniref:hypothetical protein n=1 Tax=Leclercia adecarboxylata TaxID=83655 RepID=UPI00234E2BC3
CTMVFVELFLVFGKHVTQSGWGGGGALGWCLQDQIHDERMLMTLHFWDSMYQGVCITTGWGDGRISAISIE